MSIGDVQALAAARVAALVTGAAERGTGKLP